MPPRTPIGLLRSYLTATRTPLAIFTGDRHLVWVNASLAEWFGVAEADLVGRQAAFQIDPPDDLIARAVSALAPPAAALAGTFQRRLMELPTAHGLRRRWVSYCPLVGDQGGTAVLAVIEDAFGPEPGQVELPGLDNSHLHQDLARLREQLRQWYSLEMLAGHSPSILRVRTQLECAAKGLMRCVIIGSRSCGCERLARGLYLRQNPAGTWPLIPLHCQLLDAELLTTTVVSFVRSQWQLSQSDRVVLLLLEVDRLSDEAQWALWELLQRSAYQWHTLATAGEDLVVRAERGEFRADLANYLSTITIRVPPLRDRRDDIPILAQRIVETLNAKTGRQVELLSPQAMERLTAYHWPGEWDELVGVIEHAYHACPDNRIEAAHLPEVLRHVEQAHAHPRKTPEPIRLDDVLADVERRILQRALELAKGNRARAARLLGISRPRLLRRLQQLGIS